VCTAKSTGKQGGGAHVHMAHHPDLIGGNARWGRGRRSKNYLTDKLDKKNEEGFSAKGYEEEGATRLRRQEDGKRTQGGGVFSWTEGIHPHVGNLIYRGAGRDKVASGNRLDRGNALRVPYHSRPRKNSSWGFLREK